MNKAFLAAIQNYPPPITPVWGAQHDIEEIQNLLSATGSIFQASNIEALRDNQASRRNITLGLDRALSAASEDDTQFIYFAGHGLEVGNDYFFISHDTDINHLPQTAVNLTEIKSAFDRSPSRRILMFLDFCHSGGIIRTTVETLARSLASISGEGRIIVAACGAEQVAQGDEKLNHGVFTHALLRGLRGEAAIGGEITAGSLFDFIDRQLVHQRPMYFGQQRGRIVLRTTKRNLSQTTIDRLRLKIKTSGE